MYSRLARSALSALTALLSICTIAGAAHAGLTPAQKCSAAIIKAGATFVQKEASLRQKCSEAVVKHKTCDSKTQEKINTEHDKLTTSIAKACGGKNKICETGSDDVPLADIGWPGSCPDFEAKGCSNAINDCSGIAACVACIGDAAVVQAIGLYYDALKPTDPKSQDKREKSLNKCQQTIGKAGATFLTAQSKALQKCWDGKNKGKVNDCPDLKAGDTISKAAVKLASTINKSCGGHDKQPGGVGDDADFTPTDIGFPASCTNVTFPGFVVPCGGPVTDLQSLTACVACVTRYKANCADQAGAIGLASNYPPECQVVLPTPTPTATATPTETETPTPTPTTTPGPLPGCGNGVLDNTEICDPTSATTTCPNVDETIFPCNPNTCTCDCPSKVTFSGDASDPASRLDTGWTGISHGTPVISGGDVTVALSCSGNGRPCGICTVSGPIANGAGQLDDQRCTNDTSIKCTTNTPCTAGGGTCQFFFGSNLPLAAGGITTCVVNQFNGSVSGTANVESGDAVTVAHLTSRVYNGVAKDNPCPRCIGDTTINDGTLGGTCDSGPRIGLTCDGNGDVPGRPDFGTTSLDCPPTTGGIIATLPIDLSNSTGTVTKTVTASSPPCGDLSGERCLCDVCNNVNQEPCTSNADCPSSGGQAGICGGKRCRGGGNNGGPCTVNSACPGGGLCARVGEPSQPSACLDDTTTVGILDCVDDFDGAPVDGEGECTGGPVTQTCSTASGHGQRACNTDADCGGGLGSCESANRPCFLTGSNTGNGKVGTTTLIAAGMADPPVKDTSNPTLGAVFCVGPTTADSVNAVAGLPGPGRVTLKGHASGLK